MMSHDLRHKLFMNTLDTLRGRESFAKDWSSNRAEGVRTSKVKTSINDKKTQLTLGPWETGTSSKNF